MRILSLSALDFTSKSARNRPRQIAKHGVASRRNASETGSLQIQFPDSARRRIFPVFAVSGKVREARKAGGPLRSSRPQAQPPFNSFLCPRKGYSRLFHAPNISLSCAMQFRIFIVDFGTIHDAIRINQSRREIESVRRIIVKSLKKIREWRMLKHFSNLREIIRMYHFIYVKKYIYM